jgi:hypothetical protein
MEENKNITTEEFVEILRDISDDETIDTILADVQSAINIELSELHIELYKLYDQIDKYKNKNSENCIPANILEETAYISYLCEGIIDKRENIPKLKELRDRLEEQNE